MISVFDLLVFTQIPSIGPTRLRTLVSALGSTVEVYNASMKTLVSIEGFNKTLARQVVEFFKDSRFEQAKKFAQHQLSRLNKIGGKIIHFWDESYPVNLKKIYDPPPFIFVSGEIIPNDRYSLAIVGTRNPSGYGKNITEKLTKELAESGITIVSGLARGIDSIAHASSLKANGRTLAVIGSGIDIIYPPENKNLAEKIKQHGAIISEFNIGTKPDAGNFPRRNRIISGLTLGTVIIETDLKGGAMITASTALDQNREVFAVPGTIDSNRSRGCHRLIKTGRAKLIDSVHDIFDELAPLLKPIMKGKFVEKIGPQADLNLFEQTIYDVLSDEPLHIDEIAEKTKYSTSDALVYLLSLEFKGLARQLPGKLFIRC